MYSKCMSFFHNKWTETAEILPRVKQELVFLQIEYKCLRDISKHDIYLVNSSPPGQNGRHFTDDTFKCISLNENFCILIKRSLKFVHEGPVDNNPALV